MNIYEKETDMSKMSELSQVLDDLVSCGEKMIETAHKIRECLTESDEPAPVKKTKSAKKEAKAPEAKTYSKEDVRALLAAKANESGGQFKAQVKAIVKKYGNGGSLTDIPAESYPDLVKEVEGLTDA